MVRLGTAVGRHEAARAPTPSIAASPRWPAFQRRSPTSPTPRCGPSPPARSARPRTTRSSSQRARRRGRHRGRGRLGGRGGAAHPPRRAAGAAGLRAARCSCATSAAAAPSSWSASRARCSPRRSLKLGAVRLTNRFFPADRCTRPRSTSCRRFVAVDARAFAREVGRHGFDVAVGSSGTIEQLVRLARAGAGEPQPRDVNGARSPPTSCGSS